VSGEAPTDVLIVGGGIAGYTTARTLRDLGYDGPVTVVEQEPSCVDHPPLSKRALVEGIPRSGLEFSSPAQLAEQRIHIVSGVGATAVTPTGAALSDGRFLTASTIVVAVGAAPNQPAMPGADDPRVVTLRGYDDAMRIRAHSGPGHTVLVLGGGFIGAEVAASLRTLGTAVVLVDPHELPGAHVLGTTLAGWLHQMHLTNGVDLRTTAVTTIDASAGGDEPLSVALADGTTVTADLVVAGIGVSPRTLPGVEAVAEAGGIVLPPTAHWEAARLDGQAAAARLLGRPTEPRGAAWYWTDRYGAHVEIVGDLVGKGEEIVRPGVAVFRVDGERLLGAASIDDPMTVRAARRIIDREVRVDQEALADPSVSLRRMLRS
jgi:3-phenylpropionate/trans-cinnamate dioxygenase ferredoxin reductase subunit